MHLRNMQSVLLKDQYVGTNMMFDWFVANAPPGDQDMSAQARTEMAIQRGEAQTVVCSLSF